MVKKLYKHEIIAFFRAMWPIECVVLAVGLFTRLVLFFRTDSTMFDITLGSSIVLLIVALIGGVVAAFIIGIKRFYQNLFTREGYLTFTLPVTATQHILVKVTTAVLFEIIAVVVAGISLCIACSGELLVEIVKAGAYLGRLVYQHLNGVHISSYIVEIVFVLLASLLYGQLLIYTCISIGQRARKNRVLAAVGVYFVYYIITQMVGTIFIIVNLLLAGTDFYKNITMFIEDNPYPFFHLLFCGVFVFIMIMNLVFFFVSRRIMCKKLNLE